MKITRNGLLLTIDTSLIPAQGSSDVPIEFENDTDYSGYTIEPRVAYYTREVPQSAVCQYENGQIIVPKEAFKQFGVILIAIALIDPSNGNHIEVTNALELTVQGAPLGDVTLPDTPTWQSYVTNLVNQLTASITAEIQEKLDNGDFVPSFSIGTVSTLEPDAQATATITGTNQAPVLNLGIPQGEKGDKGDKGEQGIQGVGVPDGGTDGQLLIKSSATSYDTEWVSPENIDYISSLYNRLYRPNLLINGDFQINQRGQSSYSTNLTYTLDMWYLSTNGGSITPTNNGLNVNGSSNHSTIQQFIDADYRGKQMTVVIKFKDVVYSHVYDVSTDSTTYYFIDSLGIKLYYDESKGKTSIWIRVQSDSGVIEYIDLFEGSIAYPHVKEDRGIALVRCERYLKVIDICSLAFMCISGGMQLKANGSIFGLDKMASTPTGQLSQTSFMMYGLSSGIQVNVVNVNILGYIVVINISNALTNANVYMPDSSIKLTCSCEPS